MEILVKAGQLLLALSILVTLHELGHYWAARLFKIRVDRFYLFFDFLFPLPNVLKFSVFKKKIGDTEWGLGWFPMGGYVQIAGMMDENMDKDTLAQPAKPDEFRSKPAWQRLIVMIGGVTVNLILGMLIYSMILFVWGEKYLPNSAAKYGIVADSLGQKIGLRSGDHITAIDGKTVENFNDIIPTIGMDESKNLTVKRGDSTFNLAVPKGFIGQLSKSKGEGFIGVRYKFVIEKFSGGASSFASTAGFKEGDEVIGINDSTPIFVNDVIAYLATHKTKETVFNVKHKDGKIEPIKFIIPETGKLGVGLGSPLDQFEFKIKQYSIISCIPAGITKSFEMLNGYMKGLNQLFRSLFGKSEVKASDSVGGFISIGNLFPNQWHWEIFWNITAVLSLILAIMNLLPIPALDGGHVIFCLYEMLTGRKPHEKVLEYAQYVGMALLLGLMIYVNGNDIYKFIIVKFLH